MYVTKDIFARWEARYGNPKQFDVRFAIQRDEMDMVRASMRHGRAHDITLFIFDGDQLALIRKPIFPPGAFRAPSGGLEPGETLELGAVREALEETGLDIVLDRYLLRANASFDCGADLIRWVSHVFSAHAVGGELSPIDTDEIAEACYANVAQLQGPMRSLILAQPRGLFHYRATLTDATIAVLETLGMV